MVFHGISRFFSTEGDRQYATIGAFWEELSEVYGRSSLRGLGYRWTPRGIEYAIGLKEGMIPGGNCSVELPDDGWVTVRGRTSDLGRIYEGIYRDGPLKYEIEMFDDLGGCVVMYRR